MARPVISDTAPPSVPAGVVSAFAGAAAPTGYLMCDGASYLRATYADLFTALGGASSPYGLPDGTHFNVPDLRDRAPVGVSGTITLASSGGAKTVALVTAEMPAHGHYVYMMYAGGGVLDNNDQPYRSGGGSGFDTTGASYTTAVGSGTAHQNMPPYLGLNYIIKT
jgi:microcystin-dependent protein